MLCCAYRQHPAGARGATVQQPMHKPRPARHTQLLGIKDTALSCTAKGCLLAVACCRPIPMPHCVNLLICQFMDVVHRCCARQMWMHTAYRPCARRQACCRCRLSALVLHVPLHGLVHAVANRPSSRRPRCASARFASLLTSFLLRTLPIHPAGAVACAWACGAAPYGAPC